MKRWRIAIDVMGGDLAPAPAIEAAARMSLRRDDVHVLLVGDRDIIARGLQHVPHDIRHLEIVPAQHVIPMDADPKTALATYPDASIVVAVGAVADGHADAVVSAGNTGGVVMACAKRWQRLGGIARTALGAVIPTENARGAKHDPFCLLLDAGITVDATAEDLVAFARMGSAYARCISDNAQPSVALLSNGTEPYKGTARIVDAHHRLQDDTSLHFVGNIEGTDIPRGTADVIVTDGFTGNVALKLLEGSASTFASLLRSAANASIINMAAFAMLGPSLAEMKRTFDWEQYGGAPLLGFEHICIKAHGRSTSRALYNAIKVAARCASAGLIDDMRQRLASPTASPSSVSTRGNPTTP